MSEEALVQALAAPAPMPLPVSVLPHGRGRVRVTKKQAKAFEAFEAHQFFETLPLDAPPPPQEGALLAQTALTLWRVYRGRTLKLWVRGLDTSGAAGEGVAGEGSKGKKGKSKKKGAGAVTEPAGRGVREHFGGQGRGGRETHWGIGGPGAGARAIRGRRGARRRRGRRGG